MRTQSSAVILILVILATVAASCAPSPRTEPAAPASSVDVRPPRAPRTVVISIKVEPATLAAFSPANSGFSTNSSVRSFSAFLELVDDRGAVRPYLAETLPQLNTDTWRVFPDGRMETAYRLKPNLKWHDGAPLTSEDFVFAWRVYTTPELGFPAAAAVPMSVMDEVIATDSSSFVIRWKRPYPGAANLQSGGSTNLGLPALPKHILDTPYREERWESFTNLPFWTTEFVGAGPYRLARWEAGSFVEGEIFDDHVLGRPKIERVRFVFISDTNTAMANIRAGTVHLATEGSLTFDQALELKREWAPTNGGTFLWTTASLRYMPFQFRPEFVGTPAILDVRVRKALFHTLDKAGLSDAVWGGEGILLDSFFSPRTDYYPTIDRAITKYPLDPRAAERLMNEAGYSRGADGVYTSAADGRVVIEILSTGGGTGDTERSSTASDWRKAGFDAQERNLPQALSLDGLSRANFPGLSLTAQSATETTMSAAFATAQIGRPENRWNGINRGGYSNPEYDRVVDAFNSVLDPNERIQQRASIAKIISDELPGLLLYYNLQPAPHVAALTGPTPTGSEATGYVTWNILDWDLT